MTRKGTPSYLTIMRSFALAEKILKNFGSEAGETQNKSDDLVIVSALLELKKRLDDLSKKTRAGKIMSKAIKRYNHKTPAGHKAESTEEREDACERDYDEAYSIFKDAADAGIELPNIPAVDGTFWSFKLLHNWCNEALRKISKLLQKYIRKIVNGTPAQKRQQDEAGKIVKLTDFMRDYCEKPLSVESKANRIHTFVKNKKIRFMPKPVNKTKGNQTKLYRIDDLKTIWGKLQQIIKSLPNLKD